MDVFKVSVTSTCVVAHQSICAVKSHFCALARYRFLMQKKNFLDFIFSQLEVPWLSRHFISVAMTQVRLGSHSSVKMIEPDSDRTRID